MLGQAEEIIETGNETFNLDTVITEEFNETDPLGDESFNLALLCLETRGESQINNLKVN